MKNIKIILKSLFVLGMLLVGQISYADGTINLTIKNNGVIVYSGAVTLPAAGMTDVNATDGTPHSVDARSVLNIVTIADGTGPDFNVSNLIYYSSFNAFYLKCITVTEELCDNWQYKVNDTDPGMGMDQDILAGGENVVLFFGDENPIPAPTPPPEPSSSSGGHSQISGSYPQPIFSLPVTSTPVTIPLAIPTPLAVMPTKTETQEKFIVPQVVKKHTSSKTLAKINNLAASSPAAVIKADSVPEVTPAPREEKSWIKIILKWLFGF